MRFTENFNTLIQGLQILNNHIDNELNTLNSRCNYLEDKVNELDQRQSKDDDFYKGLETLIQMRNR